MVMCNTDADFISPFIIHDGVIKPRLLPVLEYAMVNGNSDPINR